MKTYLCLTVLGLIAGLSGAHAAEEKQPTNPDKKELRTLAAPDPERRTFWRRAGEMPDKVEKEAVAFLGVETGPASATLGAQLGLPRGSGLVVNHVVPKSPADGVLNQHDVLLRIDDQILIESRQLAVLVRSHKEGDEVTLTYLRAGQKATAKVKLGKHEVPKMSALFESGPNSFFYASPGGDGGQFEFRAPAPRADREEVDHVLSLMQRARSAAGPVRIQLDRSTPGVRAMSINAANSNLMYSDDAGSLDLTIKDGVKNLVAKNAKGDVLFSGPVTTPEERKAMPPEVRERLENLEGMHDITFHTDGDFQGAETRVVRPPGRGIAMPYRAPMPPAPRPFF